MTVLKASRPNFLILAPVCAGLAIVVTWRQGAPLGSLHILLVVAGALLAHAAVNLLNEYEDFRSGLDLLTTRTPFSGGSGALPADPEAAPRVLRTAVGAIGIAGVIGLYFLWLRGLPMLLLGLGGLGLVLGYTRWITRSPWLCLLAPGLGFGPVMILASQIALGGQPDNAAILVSIVVMLLVSELLLINQIPDTDADRRAGRRHVPIVLGPQTTAKIVSAQLLGAYLVVVIGISADTLPPASGLALLPLPAALWIALRLPHALADTAALTPVLGVNVGILLATLIMLGLGLSIG